MQLDTIDTSEHPSDWYIFEPRFLARSIGLARQYLDKNMPDEVPTTTDKEFDRLLQLQPANFWLNCAEMAELIHNGYPLDLINYKDCLTVYTYVQNHLEKAMKVLVNNINTMNAPLDDLLMLDSFADRVFAHARFLMPKSGGAVGTMIQGLDITGLGQVSIFKAVTAPSLKDALITSTEEDDGYPKRESFASQIANLQTVGIENGTYTL
jgi:hypothetical protein